MDKKTAEKVLAHPDFKKMSAQKSFFGWIFSAVIVIMYVLYIWAIGERPDLLNSLVVEGQKTTWGIYIGIFVIVFSFVVTGIYVYLANGKFEKITKDVVDHVKEDIK